MNHFQKTKEYTLKIVDNFILDLNLIDEWLVDVIKISIEPFDLKVDQKLNSRELEIYQFAWRALLLSRDFFQALKIPVFDKGKIVEIKKLDTKEYLITLGIVYIENISKQVFLSVISFTVNIILNFMNKNKSAQNIDKLFNLIQNQLFDPFKDSSGSGKSTLPILQTAYEMGIPFNHLSNGIYQLGWGSRARQLNRSIIDSDSAIGTQISQNKVVTAMMLRNGGLPAPEHTLAATKEELLTTANKFGWPVVIKPVDKDRGEGVNVDINDEESLFSAFKKAQDISSFKEVIVERQVCGVCFRIFIANNKMLYGVKRLPKGLKGDGRKTIDELIDDANRSRDTLPVWKRDEPFPKDEMALKAIMDAGFTIDSIPKPDEFVPLRKIESTSWGGVDVDISEIIHPDNIDAALRAARLFRLDVAGIDIISSDITIPWHKNGAIINEVNFSPLLGGGEISRKRIPAFLKEFIINEGRIPIIAIVGDKKAMDLALKMQKEQIENKIGCFITSDDKTFSDLGEEIYLTGESLIKRCEALLFDKRVDSLILVAKTNKLLEGNLLVNLIDKVIEV